MAYGGPSLDHGTYQDALPWGTGLLEWEGAAAAAVLLETEAFETATSKVVAALADTRQLVAAFGGDPTGA